MKTHRSNIRLVDGSENEDDRDDDRCDTDDAKDGTDGQTDNFRRKLVKSFFFFFLFFFFVSFFLVKIGEIKAHFLFEN